MFILLKFVKIFMVKTIIEKRSCLGNTQVDVDVWDNDKSYLSVWTFTKSGIAKDQINFKKEELQIMLKALS